MKLIPLSKHKNNSINQSVMVDDEDYDFLMQWKWHIHSRYARASIYVKDKGRKKFYMHRILLNLTDPKIICDHIDINGLNNQRKNLRIANHSQNGRNRKSAKNSTSKYLGVCWNKQYQVWESSIYINGKTKHLGKFKEEIIAAKAYDEAAKIYHGDFANLNL